MCEPIKEKNIHVEFVRCAELRATEVVIINHDLEGEEKQGLVMWCYDNGDIRGLGGAPLGHYLVDGARVV